MEVLEELSLAYVDCGMSGWDAVDSSGIGWGLAYGRATVARGLRPKVKGKLKMREKERERNKKQM